VVCAQIPSGSRDKRPSHLTERGDGGASVTRIEAHSSQTYCGEAHSPVAILLTDPSGKRIGFGPSTSTVVNEIGNGAFYSGPISEPQFIDIGGALPGQYVLAGVGTGVGRLRWIVSMKTVR
jgi:hypothetical protein